MLRTRLLTGFAALLIANSASASTNKVCMGGNVEQLSSTQRMACQQAARQVQNAADAAGASNWHFVVVCDEAGWQDYAAFSTMPAEELPQASMDTNVAQRTTFVRAGRVAGTENKDLLTVQMAAIAHSGASTAEVATLR